MILGMVPLLCVAKPGTSPDTISARRAFAELPEISMEILSKDSRLDMLDYYDNGSTYAAKNNLRGTARLDTVTPDFVAVELTPVSSLEVKILPTKGGDIVMTLYTVGAEGDSRDTEIRFYDAELNPLPAEKYLPKIRIEDFFDTKGYKTKPKELIEMLPFHAVYFETRPGENTLTARLTYHDVMTVEDTKIIELFSKPLQFQWIGGRWRPAAL